MNKPITKQEILDLVKDKSFKTEDEFRDYLVPRLAKLFKINEDQIVLEKETTSFDGLRSERADIVIHSNEDFFKRALIVIELKLSRNIQKYYDGNLLGPQKQLWKYCQDTRSPYGILLTEEHCFIYRNKYFNYDQVPKRILKNKIPTIKQIEEKIALELFITFFLFRRSFPIILILLFITSYLLTLSSVMIKQDGMIVTSIFFSAVVLISVIVFWLFTKIFKIFD